MQPPSRFDEASAAAGRRALVPGAVGAVLVGLLVSVLVSIVLGVVALVLLGGAWVMWVQSSFSGAMERVVRPLGSPVADGDLEGFRNAVDGVAILTGVSRPELRVIESETANALVAADAGNSSVVVLTSGLLEGARTVEQEVLSAELLCRVRDGSARFGTLAAGLPPLMRWAAGLGPSAVAATLGDQRAARTDADAVSVTRYPPGLIAALERMSSRGTEVPGAAADTAALWIAPAVGESAGVDPAVDRTANQSLDHRIAVLREL